MDEIRIKDLKLRAVIGVEEWEKNVKQDIVINIKLEFDASKAAASDDLEDTIDYKALKLKIIDLVENSAFQLVEKLAGEILKLCMSDDKVQAARVEVDKPHALRFAESVSLTLYDKRD